MIKSINISRAGLGDPMPDSESGTIKNHMNNTGIKLAERVDNTSLTIHSLADVYGLRYGWSAIDSS